VTTPENDAAGTPVRLSTRELAIVLVWSGGATVDQTSVAVGLSPELVTTYLDSARAKYEAAGRRAASRGELREQLTRDGLVGYLAVALTLLVALETPSEPQARS